MFKKLEIYGVNKEYLISDDGKIFDVKENKYRKFTETKDGYYKVSFYVFGKYKRFLIHRLVLMTYNPVDNMDNLQVNHIDGNKKNNRIDNLEWCTLKENMKHAWNTGLCKNSTPNGINSHHHILTEEEVKTIKHLLSKNLSYQKISGIFNVSKSTIYQISNGITWSNTK